MTEDQARAALRAFVAVGEIEPWIAERPWKAVAGGWSVAGELQGWRFRVESPRQRDPRRCIRGQGRAYGASALAGRPAHMPLHVITYL